MYGCLIRNLGEPTIKSKSWGGNKGWVIVLISSMSIKRVYPRAGEKEKLAGALAHQVVQSERAIVDK